MNFVKIYETEDARNYQRVIAFLERNKLPFENLYDYRFDPSLNHDSGGPALIMVKKEDYDLVSEHLTEKTIKNLESDKIDISEAIKTPSNRLINVEQQFQNIINKQIIKVDYVFQFEPEDHFDLGDLHQLDIGIVITFDDKSKFAIVLTNEGFDFGEGVYSDYIYVLTKTIEQDYLNNFKALDSTAFNTWKGFINRELKSFKIFGQSNNQTDLVTDIKLEFNSDSTNFPYEKDDEIVVDLSIGVEALMVVFDESLLDEFERIRK
jgi:hypothetical protein